MDFFFFYRRIPSLHIYSNVTLEMRGILKILWIRGEIFCYLLLEFHI